MGLCREKTQKGLPCESISSEEECSLIGFAQTECVMQNGKCRAKPASLSLMAKPNTMPQNVYDVIKNHGGEGQYIEQKNEVIPKIASALILTGPNRNVEIKRILAEKEALAGLDTKIIALLSPSAPPMPILSAKPDNMPQDVYEAIRDFVGADQHIAQKNQLIPAVNEALLGLAGNRDLAIARAIAGQPALAGLDALIINLLPAVILAKPDNMPQDVYETIKNFDNADQHIRQKNQVIPVIDQAIALGGVNRDVTIETAIAGQQDLGGLDLAIIDLLAPILREKPDSMPQDVYDTIKDFNGADQYIKQKNQVIRRINAALTGALADRDRKITAAIRKVQPHLNGLDLAVIRLLLLIKPDAMPEDVYEAIKDLDGEDQHIEQKNQVIPAIARALLLVGPDRDIEIRRAIAGRPTLAGLDNTIIGLLLMTKPDAMPENVYGAIRDFGGVEQHIAQKNQLIPEIIRALGEAGEARDEAIIGAIAGRPDLRGLDTIIISLLPAILKGRPQIMPQNVYDTIINSGGINQNIPQKNQAIRAITAALAGPEGKRDAAITKAIGTIPQLAGIDVAVIRLLPAVYMDKPDLMPQVIYDSIKNQNGQDQDIRQKNQVIIEIVQALNGPPADRDAAITRAVNGQPALAGMADALIRNLIFIKPDAMDQDVYNILKTYGGREQHITEKNQAIREINVALTGPEADRDNGIRAALNRHPPLAALASILIATLPPTACPLLPPDAVTAREREVGPQCYIPGPNDPFDRSDLRSGIRHYPDTFQNAQAFIKAIEDRCHALNAPILSNINETAAQTRSRLIRTIWTSNLNYLLFSNLPGLRFIIDRPNIFKEYLESLFVDGGMGRYKKTASVRFNNEEGIDAGGLLRDFLDRVSEELKTMFFKAVEDGDRDTLKVLASYDSCTVATQVRDKMNCWNNIGALFAKLTFIENERGTPPGVPHVRLPYLLLNKLIGIPFNNLVDYLAVYKLDNPEEFGVFMRMLKLSPGQITVSYLDFEDLGEPARDVTVDNYYEYLVKKIKIDSDFPQLRFFQDQFESMIPNLREQNINARTLALLFEGNPTSVDDLRGKLVAEGGTNLQNTQYKNWLLEITTEELAQNPNFLKALLRFWTGSSALPAAGTNVILRLLTYNPVGNLPVAHTCFHKLDIPLYVSKEQFKAKLKSALENAGGFDIQ